MVGNIYAKKFMAKKFCLGRLQINIKDFYAVVFELFTSIETFNITTCRLHTLPLATCAAMDGTTNNIINDILRSRATCSLFLEKYISSS